MVTLNDTLTALTKRYGKVVVKSASDLAPARRIRSEVPAYDYVSGGGYAVNRIIEHYGDYSSLKSYMAYIGIGKFQKYDWANDVPDVIKGVSFKSSKSKSKDASLEDLMLKEISGVSLKRGYKPLKKPRVKRCVLIDIEGTYDKAWGEKLGIDNEALLYLQPGSLNQAVDIAIALLSDDNISLVVIDSMVAIGADAETDKSMEDNQMSVNALFWNRATRNLQAAINRNPENDITLICMNGYYDKVGVSFGNPEQVKNGKQFSLAKSVSVRFTPLKEIKVDDVTVGRNISLKNKKNKGGRQYMDVTLYFSYIDDGSVKAGTTDVTNQLIELGLKFEIIDRKGSTYSYKDFSAVGMEKFKTKLEEDTETISNLKEEVYAKF